MCVSGCGGFWGVGEKFWRKNFVVFLEVILVGIKWGGGGCFVWGFFISIKICWVEGVL